MQQILYGGGGLLAGVAIVFALSRFLLGQALTSLQGELAAVQDALATEREDRRKDLADVQLKMRELERLYDEQRREKHRLAQEYTRVSSMLGVIVALAERCTCGALDIVKDLMSRVVATVDPTHIPNVEGDRP